MVNSNWVDNVLGFALHIIIRVQWMLDICKKVLLTI